MDRYLVGGYYDPATGQFLTVDPLVDQTEQPYVYVADDPVDSLDLLGTDRQKSWNSWISHPWSPVTCPVFAGWGALKLFGTKRGLAEAAIVIGTDGLGEVEVTALADDGLPTEVTGIARGAKDPFHVIDRIMGREGHGISSDAFRGAIKNPLRITKQANGTFRLIGKNATVVINKGGKIVTARARNSKGWRH